jgi:hypothetical protein
MVETYQDDCQLEEAHALRAPIQPAIYEDQDLSADCHVFRFKRRARAHIFSEAPPVTLISPLLPKLPKERSYAIPVIISELWDYDRLLFKGRCSRQTIYGLEDFAKKSSIGSKCSVYDGMEFSFGSKSESLPNRMTSDSQQLSPKSKEETNRARYLELKSRARTGSLSKTDAEELFLIEEDFDRVDELDPLYLSNMASLEDDIDKLDIILQIEGLLNKLRRVDRAEIRETPEAAGL